MRRRILLADDHGIVLDGMRRILEPEYEIVGEATDGRQLHRGGRQAPSRRDRRRQETPATYPRDTSSTSWMELSWPCRLMWTRSRWC